MLGTNERQYQDKKSESYHKSKKVRDKAKAIKAKEKSINMGEGLPEVSFEFDGTSYVCIQKGGSYNVRTK